MSPYADALLRFAHAAVRGAARVDRGVHHRHPADPGHPASCGCATPTRRCAAAARRSPTGRGGTRLGEVLKAFLDRWGQRGTARGAVVVVCSDGWERGGAELLAEQMARLRRLAHAVVWVNPHKGRTGYEPLTGGMVAALPPVDHFVSGHSMAALRVTAAARM